MRRVVNRRRFLQLLSAAGIGVHLGACEDYEATTGPGGSGGTGGTGGSGGAGGTGGTTSTTGGGAKVLVIGGGLAGLTAAWELDKKGHQVTVIEGQTRVGGRVHTHRDGWENGQHVEEGAVRIPDVHEHTVQLATDLGLTLEEFQSGDPLYYIDGTAFKHEDGMPWPVAGLVGDEVDKGLAKYDDYILPFFEEFGNYRLGEFPKPGALQAYGGMSWAEFLESKGASDPWIKLYASDNGSEISKIAALIWMATEVADYDWNKTYHIQGGNDQLATKLAEKLGDKVLLGRKVLKIEHTDTGVTVHVDNAGTMETFTGDHLVCAIPFSTLRKVEISPALPADKSMVISDLYMMPSSRGFFQTSDRFWQDQGLGGIKLVKTDTPVERIWDLSNVQAGDTGMLMSYMQYENALAFDALPEAGRKAYLEDIIDGFFPGFAGKVVAYHQKSWALDPWVEGAWTDLLPDQWAWFDIIRRAEGRIHFAGEHTSIWAGWMQGAIESGKRAATEITG